MYPALAVAGEFGSRTDMLWVGRVDGIEERLVTRAGISYRGIPAAGLHGVGLRALPGNLLELVRGTLAARELLKAFDPDVLFFTGGYVGGPVALAGWRRPTVTYVPDIEPALAQRLVGRLADRICVTTEDSRRCYPDRSKLRITGYPTRFDNWDLEPAAARRQLNLSDDIPVVLVVGGSLGARSINEAIWSSLEALLDRCQLLHITGERDWPQVAAESESLTPFHGARYHPSPYLHEQMGTALAASDLVVSRAGASVLGEYPLFALPSVLVPYPHAWRYQRTNASYLVGRGAAVAIDDEEVGERLAGTVLDLLEDEERRNRMGAAAAVLAKPGAVAAIASEIRSVAGEGGSA